MGLDPSKLSTGFLRAIHREPVKRPANAPQKPPVTSEAPKPYQHATHAQIDRPVPNPEPQRDETQPLGCTAQGKEEVLGRVRVRFTGYRVRPLDPDNFAGSCKDSLDFLRHCGLIDGDEPWKIIFETEQVKVRHFSEERTEIEVELK